MVSNGSVINSISRWLNYLLAIPMITFGIIGALLTILVFTKQSSFRRNPTITYLLAGSIMTAIHLPSIYLQSILVDGFGLGVFNTNDLACREHNYLFYVTTIIAISFPCWAAFDQYASTSRETNFRHRWSSMRIVRLAIILTILFWTIIYLPMLFYSGIDNGVCIITSNIYRKFNNYFFTPLAFTVTPLTLIIIWSQRTIENLHSMKFTNQRDRLTRQIRRMLIPQLIVLGISGIPFGLQNIYLELTLQVSKDDLRLSIEHLFISISDSVSAPPLTIHDVEQDAFSKAAKAFSDAKKYFVENEKNQYQWSDGNCTWVHQPHSWINERHNDDVLTYSSFRGRMTTSYSVIITCLARSSEDRRVITLFIGSNVNGKTIEIPIGQYSTTEDYTTIIQENFKTELMNMLSAIYKQRKPIGN